MGPAGGELGRWFAEIELRLARWPLEGREFPGDARGLEHPGRHGTARGVLAQAVVLGAHRQFGEFAAVQAQDRGRQRRAAGVGVEDELEGLVVAGGQAISPGGSGGWPATSPAISRTFAGLVTVTGAGGFRPSAFPP